MRATSLAPLAGLLIVAAGPVSGQSLPGEEIEEITITGQRLAPFEGDASFAVTVLSGSELRALPALRLDEALRTQPGLGLFRRASSLTAHPTTQGVTLRALGPNGAGRTLVTLDGIPLNDPFGGWVYWSALSADGLASVRVLKGSGAGRWGSGAISGTIELESQPIEETGGTASFRYGRLDTLEVSGTMAISGARLSARVSGGYFESDGFFLLPEEQRGVVDVAARSSASRVSGEVSAAIDSRTTLTGVVRYFEEARINGLALATNRTDALDLSVRITHRAASSGPDWQAAAYYKSRDFANSFASVTTDRGSTRMVLDQFDVPASGYGANGLVRWSVSPATGIETGFDIRRMAGETNERFRNLGAGFTRGRLAGGDELIAGSYLEISHTARDDLQFTGGIRVDRWRAFDGVRRESDLADGAILRDDTIADRSGWVPSGRAGLSYQARPDLRLRASAYTGFRLPTINELYRPFRVRNDITEANPALEPERLTGIDIGLDLEPAPGFAVEIGYFRNWLKDGIGNVTLALGPGFFPPTGFVPAGGSLRQRRNIDRITADGIEITVKADAGADLQVDFQYLYVNARVTRSATAPELVGKRLAQSPRHQFSIIANYAPDGPLSATATLRYVSDQFDDDLNARVLAGFATVGVRAEYAFGKGRKGGAIALAVDNLFDAEIQSALSGAGLLTLGQPRLWWLELRAGF